MKSFKILIVLTIYLINCAQSSPLALKNNTIEAIFEAYGYHINPEELGTDFQGDIVATEEEIIQYKSGITDQRQMWPKGVLVYYISPDFDQDQVNTIGKGMRMISSQTCIRFRAYQNGDVNYVYFRKHDSACNSEIGMKRGRGQDINLADWCFTNGGGYGGSIAHEMLHALGWNHEHTRPDRDDYIYVDFENIVENAKHNYYVAEGSSTYNVGYDYGSVMHYGLRGGFAKNQNKNVMTPRYQYSGQIGQRKELSKSDAQKVQNMYRGVCA